MAGPMVGGLQLRGVQHSRVLLDELDWTAQHGVDTTVGNVRSVHGRGVFEIDYLGQAASRFVGSFHVLMWG